MAAQRAFHRTLQTPVGSSAFGRRHVDSHRVHAVTGSRETLSRRGQLVLAGVRENENATRTEATRHRLAHAAGRLRLVATIADPRVITRILAHLGLPLEPPCPVPPRQPRLVALMPRIFRGEVPEATLRDQMEMETWLADQGFGKLIQALEHSGADGSR